jgi:hypothetical protein
MRTKTLLATAALAAAGVVTSMAQVSVNIVGYVNKTVPAGKFAILANPLNNADNKISTVIASPPSGLIVYRWDNAGSRYIVNSFDIDLGWDDAGAVIAPGEGFFVKAPAAGDATITFVGEVATGALSNPLPGNFSIRASQVPQAGKLQEDLSFPSKGGDIVYRYNVATQGYVVNSFDVDLGWDTADGSSPSVDVAEGFYLFRQPANAGAWTRTFNVQ